MNLYKDAVGFGRNTQGFKSCMTYNLKTKQYNFKTLLSYNYDKQLCQILKNQKKGIFFNFY